MGCGPERILRLWPTIWDKHVTFYGLWPGMTSLELWLGIANEHEEPWVVAWVGECCRWECAGCGQYRWVQMDYPPQCFANEFGSLGTLRTMFVPGNSTWRCGVWSVAWFPHVLYRLWPIGVAVGRFEILNRRCKTLITWLWPCERTGTRFPDVL